MSGIFSAIKWLKNWPIDDSKNLRFSVLPFLT